MRQFVCMFAPVVITGWIVLTLTGCRPSHDVSQNQTPAPHGDLIVPPAVTASTPAKTVASPAPIPVGASPTPAIASTAPPTTVAIAATASAPVATLPKSISAPPLASPVAAPAPETPKPSVIAPTSTPDGYSIIGFDKLASYNFEVDDAPVTNVTPASDKANEQIPSRVKALNGEKVSVKGFMLPLKVADGSVTEFLIMKDQSMCCFGTVPKITEWVSVKTPGKGVKPVMDQPISILGTLHVGAMRENGYLVGIYEMDGDKLDLGKN